MVILAKLLPHYGLFRACVGVLVTGVRPFAYFFEFVQRTLLGFNLGLGYKAVGILLFQTLARVAVRDRMIKLCLQGRTG